MTEQRKLIAKRLREARLQLGLTLADAARGLSRAVGEQISATRMANWESETRAPRIDQYKALADFYGVSPAYLAGLDDKRISPTTDNQYVVPKGGTPADQPIRIDRIDKSLALHLDYLAELKLQPENLMIASVPDDSMRNSIKKGERVLIDTRHRRVKNKDLFGIVVNDNIWIRWIRPELNQGFTIAADDDGQTPDERLTPEQLLNFQIIGRVALIASHR